MAQIPYENRSEKFLIKTFDYEKQFFHIYEKRLSELSILLKEKIKLKNDNNWNIPIKNLSELSNLNAEPCIIIGTIYKHQVHKPSILKEISEQNQLAPQPEREYYADETDNLVLEDKLQRIRLCGNINIEKVATGVVCAVKGIKDDDRFNIQEVLFCGSGPQKPLRKCGESQLLVLISGLGQLHSDNYVESLNLLQYWLRNNLINSGVSSTKNRVILAGNSLRISEEKQDVSWRIRPLDCKHIVRGIKALDTWFASWSSCVPMDVMPGAYDPTNYMMPQQPFHRCMFPLASKYSNFQSVTNPYEASIDGNLILGTSGQNIFDLLRSTKMSNSLEALRNTLIWGHLAPTAPDTLYSYPHIDSDPFIIKECPHIYFAGNCDTYATEMYHGSDGQITRLVCIPSFCKTQSIAVVNLENLDCQEISFNTE